MTEIFPPDAGAIAMADLSGEQQERDRRALLPDAASPQYRVTPANRDSLAATVSLAAQRHWRILPCGSGSKLDWGGLVREADVVVSLEKCDRLLDHAVGDLTVTVEAGIKLADLQAILLAKGQFLPLDPLYPEAATLGGIAATADAGSWRQRYGGVRDLVIGIGLIRADGKTAKAGGRVVKNVAGYDLMKLFIGSYGTLGIISELTLRTYPLPESSGTILLSGESEAIAEVAKTLRNGVLTPTVADVLSARVVEESMGGRGMGLLVRFQSAAASVEEQLAALERIASPWQLQGNIYRNADEQRLWQQLQQGFATPVLCKVGILPSAAIALLAEIEGFGIVHHSSGLGRLSLEGEDLLGQIARLRALCQDKRGFLTVLSAPADIKQQLDPWGYTGNALGLMRELKQQFDPKMLLSPGRFVSGI